MKVTAQTAWPEPLGDAYYSVPIGYLRAAGIVGVVAVHSVLAYCSFVPPQQSFLGAKSEAWQAYPIVDGRRWAGFDPIVGFTDPFAMSLLFFLSGMFVWESLQRKGSDRFVRDRMIRLGVPFVFASIFLSPLAYFPTYLASSRHTNLGAFIKAWLSYPVWPIGPAWFLWVLLTFDCLAAGVFVIVPGWCDLPVRSRHGVFRRPALFFWTLVGVTGVAYLPMVLAFGPARWSGFGPFSFQTSRLLHYAIWCLAGVFTGAYGLQRSVIAPNGELARNWLRWLGWSTFLWGVLVVVAHPAITSAVPSWWVAVIGMAWVLSCAASVLFVLAVFVRFVGTRTKLLDNLRENAYGIYLTHYVFVIWLQYFLLRFAFSAVAKGAIVFAGALVLSWASVATLRRATAIAHVI
jgi:hypothetical protein